MRRINKTRFVAGLIGGVLTSSPALAQTSPTQQCVANAYAGGTSDAITIPALPCALSTNLLILSTTSTNVTTTPTLQPLGLPAQTIIRSNGNPVQAGDLVAGGKALLTATGTQWVLLNPSNVTGGSGSINGAPAGYMAYYANTGSILSGSPLGAGVLTSLSYASDTPYGFVNYNGALGTPSSGTATYITGLPVTTGISGLGLGVAIALGLSPGAIGSFVVNGGALGVPTSGVATYLTGLPLTSGVTGTLGVANGGTGGTSFTTNRPIVGNGSGALTTGSTSGTGFILATELAAIPAGHCVDVDGNGNLADAGGTCTTGGSSGVVASGSVGQIATYSGSTNVVTALGVNVGTAGSFVVQGGVLGTPSSGVASNLTSIPMGNASGTLGVSNGGTGAGTFSSGKPILGNGTGTFTSASISGNTTTLATTNGTLPSGDCAKFDASGNIVDSGGSCGSPLSANNTWTGTNTFNNSVSFVLNPTFPVQSPNVVFAGPTSGGSTTPTWRALVAADLPTVTVATGGTGQTSFTANLPLLGNGSGAITQGTVSGNTTEFGTVSGALTGGDCAKFDASGNIVDNGGACGVGILGNNNTWTGTNTFSSSVSFAANPTFPAGYSGNVYLPPTACGGSDDTTALQAAITSAETYGGTVWLPVTSTGCKVSGTLTVNNMPVRIAGIGPGAKIVGTLSAASDLFHIAPGGACGYCYYPEFENFQISISGGLNLFDFDTTTCTCYIARPLIRNINTLGSTTLSGAPILFSGTISPIYVTFGATVENNFIFANSMANSGAGVTLQNGGDSIHLYNNFFTGPGYSAFVSQVPGAGNFILEGGDNFTCGGILIENAIAPIIRDTQLETAQYNGTACTAIDGAVIYLGIGNVYNAIIDSTQIQSPTGTGYTNGIYITSGANVVSLNNLRITSNVGGTNGIAVVGTAGGVHYGTSFLISGFTNLYNGAGAGDTHPTLTASHP